MHDQQASLIPSHVDRDANERSVGLKPATGAAAWVWRVMVLAGTSLAGLCFLLDPIGKAVLYAAITLSAALAMVIGVLLHRPERSAPWYFIAVDLVLIGVGDLSWAYAEHVLGLVVQFPSLVDAVYLLSYVVLAFGLLLMVRGRSGGDDHGNLLDAAVVTIGCGVMVWVFLMEPYATDASLPVGARVTAIAYPLTDILW